MDSLKLGVFLSKRLLVLLLMFILGAEKAFSQLTEVEVNLAVNEGRPIVEGSTMLRGPGFELDVVYEDFGDFGVVEGDIYVPLTPSSEVENDSSSNSDIPTGDIGVDGVGFRWPNQTLHYRFDNVVDDTRNTMLDAMRHIQQRTNVSFIEATDPSIFHVLISDNILSDGTGRSGCNSFVGYRRNDFADRGFQRLNVQRLDENNLTCNVIGIAIHELLHALGVLHEVSREDREEYVTVVFENIISGREGAFSQRISTSTDIGTYDYGSVMHYRTTGFSRNGLPTIIPLQEPGVQIGQRVRMDEGDIETVNALYPIERETGIFSRILPALLNLMFEGD